MAGRATGASRGRGSELSWRCSGIRQPRKRKRSSSLFMDCAAIVGRRVEVRSMESETLLDLYLFFFVPLSRMNDPMMTKFDTNAEAKISEDAQTVRYCCLPRFEMTSGMRKPVMRIKAMEVLNKALVWSLRRQVWPERSTIGIGNATRRMSVMISAEPMVSSCA